MCFMADRCEKRPQRHLNVLFDVLFRWRQAFLAVVTSEDSFPAARGEAVAIWKAPDGFRWISGPKRGDARPMCTVFHHFSMI